MARICEGRSRIIGILRAKTRKQGEVFIKIKDHWFLRRVKHLIIMQGFPVAGGIVTVEVGNRGGVIIGLTLNLTRRCMPLIFLKVRFVFRGEPLPSVLTKTSHNEEWQIADKRHNLSLLLFTVKGFNTRVIGGANLVNQEKKRVKPV